MGGVEEAEDPALKFGDVGCEGGMVGLVGAVQPGGAEWVAGQAGGGVPALGGVQAGRGAGGHEFLFVASVAAVGRLLAGRA